MISRPLEGHSGWGMWLQGKVYIETVGSGERTRWEVKSARCQSGKTKRSMTNFGVDALALTLSE